MVCVQLVNRQLREKEEEAAESREKMERLAEETRSYTNHIQQLQVFLLTFYRDTVHKNYQVKLRR
jgi:hypothetical protein